MKPRLLDLFCCQGGAARGYADAGFEVVGVDIAPQRRYPYEFHQADALEFLAAHGREFDAIHASPPCQLYSVTRHSHDKKHPDLLPPTLTMLGELGMPWVVENVPGAPIPNAAELCGASFHLTADDIDGVPLVLKRHRLFGASFMLMTLPCQCADYRRRGIRVGGVYGGGPSNRKITNRALGTFRGGYTPTQGVRAALMGIDWMSGHGLAQAIPPAYTEFIGEQLRFAIEVAA